VTLMGGANLLATKIKQRGQAPTVKEWGLGPTAPLSRGH